MKDFDSIAFAYDKLARVVYGKSIVESQKYFLLRIPAGAKVLILGGGTGWILTELFKINPTCEVWYIEASEKMIALSQKQTGINTVVHFINGTEQAIPDNIKFDVVLTNFYLDLFTESSLQIVIKKIQQSLRTTSLWIATDFVYHGKYWQKVMLKTMYMFFRKVCGIESKQLPDWNKMLNSLGLKKSESKNFYYNFIETTLYHC